MTDYRISPDPEGLDQTNELYELMGEMRPGDRLLFSPGSYAILGKKDCEGQGSAVAAPWGLHWIAENGLVEITGNNQHLCRFDGFIQVSNISFKKFNRVFYSESKNPISIHISNCTFKKLRSAALRAKCTKIESVYISHNIVDGVISKYGAVGFMVGTNPVEQGRDYLISHNTIKNISAAVNSDDPCLPEAHTEAHGIFCFGECITVEHNHIEWIRNDGRHGSSQKESKVVRTEGAEGIYIKARFSTIRGNTLINAGAGMDGALAIKGRRQHIPKSLAKLLKAEEAKPIDERKISPPGNDCIIELNTIKYTDTYPCINYKNGGPTGIYLGTSGCVAKNNTIEGAYNGIRFTGDRIKILSNQLNKCVNGIETHGLMNDLTISGNTFKSVGYRGVRLFIEEVSIGSGCNGTTSDAEKKQFHRKSLSISDNKFEIESKPGAIAIEIELVNSLSSLTGLKVIRNNTENISKSIRIAVNKHSNSSESFHDVIIVNNRHSYSDKGELDETFITSDLKPAKDVFFSCNKGVVNSLNPWIEEWRRESEGE